MFADDLGQLAQVDSLDEARAWDQLTIRMLVDCLEEWDMKLNTGKKESILRLVGPGSSHQMRQAYHAHPPQLPSVEGRLQSQARYLGPHIHVSLRTQL